MTNTGASAVLLATAGGELDVKASTITDNTSGSEQIDTGSELLVDTTHLTLNGDGSGRVVLSGTALITGAAKADELENYNKTISGAGSISNLVLVNDASGVIDANNVGGATLTIDTGNTVTNAGLMEATGGGTLDVKDVLSTTNTVEASGSGSIVTLEGNVTNTGASAVLLATAGGELDVKASTITDNTSGSEQIDTGSELLVDTTHLTLNGDGSGRVVLSGTALITGAAKADELENYNKTISGAGSISNLVLVNDASGVIDANNVGGATLTIDTGNTVTNAGLMEATGGGTLDVKDVLSTTNTVEASGSGSIVTLEGNVTNTGASAVLLATAGGELDVKASTITDNTSGSEQIDTGSELLVDTTHLTLNGDGSGRVVLSGTALITGAAKADELENYNKTISGAGSISNLVLVNDASGVIDANNVGGATLTIDTGNTVTNAGLMEATGGGTLDVKDVLSTTNTVEASGSGSIVTLEGNVTNTGASAVLLATAGGELDVKASTITDNTSGSEQIDTGLELLVDTTHLTLNGDGSGRVVLSGTALITGAAKADELENYNKTISGAGSISNLVLVNDASGVIDANNVGGATLTIDTGNTVTNAGLMEATGGGTLDVKDVLSTTNTVEASGSGSIVTLEGNVTNTGASAVLLATAGGELDVKASTITDNTSGSEQIDTGSELLVDTTHLTLNGDGSGRVVLSGTALITGAAKADELENYNKTISGAGSISNLVLVNDASGVIDANNVGGATLTIDTGNTVTNAGLMEATGGGTLDVKDVLSTTNTVEASGSGSIVTLEGNVTNTGASAVLLATAGGELDVKASTITDNTSGSEQIDTGSELLVDTTHLTLNGDGSGRVVLSGTALITGAAKADELENYNKTISGAGSISNLVLVNDASGVIDANNVGGATLTIDTGNTVTNAGLMEATGGGTLDVKDVLSTTNTVEASGSGSIVTLEGNVTNTGASAVLLATAGGELDVKASTITDNTSGSEQIDTGSELLVDTTHLTLNGDGSGRVVLSGTALITGAAKADELENYNKTISGAGSISNLVLVNDASGVIDANNVGGATLTIDTGNTVTNAGLMEATGGGTLDVKDVLSTTNTVEASGSGSIVTLEGNVTNTGASAVLLATAGGELDVKASTITDNTSGSEQIDTGSELLVDTTHLTLNGDGSGRVVLSGTALITGAAKADELENYNKTISGAGSISNLVLVNDASGVIDANNVGGATLTIDTGNTVTNAGLMEATGGGTLDVKDVLSTTNTVEASGSGSIVTLEGNVTNTGASAVLLATAGGELDVKASTITDNTSGSEQIDTGSELLVDTTHLTLNGDGSGRVVLSGTALITGAAKADELENYNKTISGAGSISNLVLVNDASGVIDANNVGGATLTIDTGNTVTNAGLMEATGGGTLDVKDVLSTTNTVEASGSGSIVTLEGNVTNTGASAVLLATAGGELDVKASTITDNTSGSEQIDTGSELLVDTTHLTLNGDGSGRVVLSGTALITGAAKADELENYNKTISGAGSISNLVLVNDASGVIDANNVGGATLTIDTGNTVTNAGLMEATGGGTLDVKDVLSTTNTVEASGSGSIVTLEGNVTNTGASAVLLATAGGELDVKASTITDNTSGSEQIDTGSELLVDTTHLTLNGDGSGRVVLSGTALITGAAKADELENYNKTISGAGSISNLVLVNDASGVIDANNVGGATLTIDTGNTVTNAGLMEATGGGTLDVKDVLSTTNTVEASGSGSIVTLEGNVTNTGASAVLLATAGGELDVKASTITDNTSGSEQIDTGSELLVDTTHLTLNGDGSGRVVLSGTALITGAAKADELENYNKTISGAGSISNLVLVNDASGVIDANNVGGATLTIDTGNTVTNAGLMEATGGGLLQIDDNVTNSGQVLVKDGSTVELIGDTITGGAINVSSTSDATKLEIKGTVTLNGSGTVTLSDNSKNSIVSDGSDAGTLNNDDLIQGAGTIGDGSADTLLTLNNYGDIAAVSLTGAELNLNTGSNTITNEAGATLEAKSGGTLQINSNVTNVNATTSTIVADAGGTVELVKDTVTGGTVMLDGGSNALTQTSTLQIEGTVTLTGGTVTLSDSANNTIVSSHDEVSGAATLINKDTLSGAGTIGDGSGGIDLTLDNFGTVDATGTNPLILNTGGNAIINETSGVLEASSGSMLEILSNVTNNGAISALDGGTVELVGNVTNTGGKLWATAGGELDVKAATITDNSHGIEQIDTTSTLLVDTTHLTLNGDGSGQVVLSGTAQITGKSAADELENVSKTISGAGSISNLKLVNDGSGIIDANNVGGSTLTIETGNTISNAGLLEATAGGILDIKDALSNTATVEATGSGSVVTLEGNVTNTGGKLWATAGGELDVKAATITDNSHGIEQIDTTSTLLVDTTHLTLNGDGTGQVVLSGTAQITGKSAADELENVSKTISGAGSISNLKLVNDGSGIIDANNVGGSTLTIETGNTISNAGLLEATAGGILDIKDALSNTATVEATGSGSVVTLEGNVTNTGGKLWATAGGELDVKAATITDNSHGIEQIDTGSTLLVDTTHLTLNGDGTGQVVLSGTAQIEGASAADELENYNKTISGAGSISNLTLVNDLGGTIDANVSGQTLTLATGTTVSNAGLLEANGGALTIDATPVTNTGTLEAIDDSTLTLSSDTVTNIGGTVEGAFGSLLNFDGSGITSGTIDVYGTLDSTGTSSINGANVRNTGTLEASLGTLTVASSSIGNSALIEANGGALTIDAAPVVNSGTLAASNGGTLTLLDETVTNTSGYTPVGVPNPAVYTFTGTGADVVATFVGGSAGDTSILEMSVNGGAYIVSTLNNHLSSTGATYDFGFVAAGSVLTFAILNESTGSTLSSNPALNADGDQHVWAFSYTQGTLGFTNINSGLALNFKDLLAGQGSDWDYNDFQVVVTGAAVPTPPPPSATVEVAAGSLLNLNGSSITAGTPNSAYSGGVVDVYGTLDSTGTSSISDASITNTGTLEATSGTLTIDPSSIDNSGLLEANGGALNIEATPVVNTGTLEANNSTLLITGNVTGSGDVVITGGGLANFSGSFNQNVVFTGAGTLELAHAFGGTVSGFKTGDVLDLTNLSYSASETATWTQLGSSGTLTIHDGAKTESITLVGSYTQGDFTLKRDGGTGTAVALGEDPVGVAGSPVNLALANPSGGQATGPITLTLTGVPSDWSLNEGTNLGNGTWVVETNDLSALTVLTAAAYAGATVLGATETWANADGSTGTAFVSDNVEAYAPGSPIFALSGNDTLTGAGGNDLFVFAQPIGNDTIYNFNVATDQIDLTGFAGIASFGDLAGRIANAGNGDTVITLGVGETITLHGVDAASLTAADFVFDQTPVLDNAGVMTVSDGAMVPLGGTIDNTGTIALDSTGDATDLQIIGNGVTLEGGGQVILSDSSENMIVGTNTDATLTNVDNTISGAGQIGAGDGNLTLVNETAGTIDANIVGAVLTLDTGNTIVNAGLLEASNGGTLQIDDNVSNSGTLSANGGTLLAAGNVTGSGDVAIGSGGLADFASAFDQNVAFSGFGTLELGQSANYHATVSGYSDAAILDLADINFINGQTSVTLNGAELTVTDTTQTANIAIEGTAYNTNWYVLSDGHLNSGNNGTLVVDPDITIGSGGSLEVSGTSTDMVLFTNGSGDTGSLILDDASGFTGEIAGFTGTSPNALSSDMIDLTGINFNSAGFSDAYNPTTGVLSVTDGTNSATLTFVDFTGTFSFATNGSSGTDIFDPPPTGSISEPSVLSTATSTATADSVSGSISFANSHSGDIFTDSITPDGANYAGSFSLDRPTDNSGHVSVGFDFMANNDQMNLTPCETLTQSYSVSVADAQNPVENVNQTVSVTIGGPGNDHFVFAPGIGADTVTNFNAQQDTIELDHFANAQTAQELQALITTDVHGDAVINLGHNDSVMLAGVTDTQLLHIIQAGHVLLH